MISIVPSQRSIFLVLVETLFFVTTLAGAIVFIQYLTSEVRCQPPPFPHIQNFRFLVGTLASITALGMFSAVSQLRNYVVWFWLCYQGLFLAEIGYTVLLGAAVSSGECMLSYHFTIFMTNLAAVFSWLAGISFSARVMVVATLSVMFFFFNVPYSNMVATARREDGAGLIVLQHLCRALEWILGGVGRVMGAVGRGVTIFARGMKNTLGIFYSHTLKTVRICCRSHCWSGLICSTFLQGILKSLLSAPRRRVSAPHEP